METTLRNLLDKIYELEGLVHLALKRPELKNDFFRLISDKGKDIEEICLLIRNGNNTSVSKAEENNQPVNIDSQFFLREYSLENDFEYSKEEGYNNEDENLQTENKSFDMNLDESRGKLVFSINDKFRFRKELFNNSEIDFNNSLVLVASMDSFEEAEDYFVNELGWDSFQQNVEDFFEIIKKYFR